MNSLYVIRKDFPFKDKWSLCYAHHGQAGYSDMDTCRDVLIALRDAHFYNIEEVTVYELDDENDLRRLKIKLEMAIELRK